MSGPLQKLSDAGVSIWLDDLSRALIQDGELARLVEQDNVVGVTTNPSIFASALAHGERYSEQIQSLAQAGNDVDETVFQLTTDDVRAACDVLRPVYEATGGVDGRVSIEVDPRLARDTEATIASARRLWSTVDRPNVMIKIPATVEGLPAITTVLSEGISVNVTLIFALDRYRAVLNAWLEGLEAAHAAGRDLPRIESVASFFVSRVDTEIDGRLADSSSEQAAALRGKAGIANARLAYQAFEETIDSERWKVLVAAGAHVQRPLWASTGVKDPAYPDTMYVTELVAPDTVNTMPRKTLDAVADHGEIPSDSVRGTYLEAQQVLDELAALGIDYTDVVDKLELEGVDKFEKSWSELLASVQDALARAATFGDDSEAGQ